MIWSYLPLGLMIALCIAAMYNVFIRNSGRTSQWFSTVSNDVLKIYDSLPRTHLPYARTELEASLRALDRKYKGKLDDYDCLYIRWWDYNQRFDVDWRYYNENMPEYIKLAESLCSIKAAYNKQRRQIELSKIPTEHLDISLLTQRAREESNIINSVTKELVNDRV